MRRRAGNTAHCRRGEVAGLDPGGGGDRGRGQHVLDVVAAAQRDFVAAHEALRHLVAH